MPTGGTVAKAWSPARGAATEPPATSRLPSSTPKESASAPPAATGAVVQRQRTRARPRGCGARGVDVPVDLGGEIAAEHGHRHPRERGAHAVQIGERRAAERAGRRVRAGRGRFVFGERFVDQRRQRVDARAALRVVFHRAFPG